MIGECRNIGFNGIVTFLLSVTLMLLTGCGTSKKIEVKDNSTLSRSRSEFFDNLEKVMEAKDKGIKTYYSKRISVAADGIPVYNSVNTALFFENKGEIIAKVYLPFPVVEVGKLRLNNGVLDFNSKALGSNDTKKLDNRLDEIFKAAMLGVVPKFIHEQAKRKYEMFIENNKYILEYKIADKILKIEINKDYSLSMVEMLENNQVVVKFVCDNYTDVDGYMLPKKLYIKYSRSAQQSIDADMTVKSVELNGDTKLEY